MRFSTVLRPCNRSQAILPTSCGFSLNLRQLCNARTVVLSSRTRLLQDGLADLHDCHKCSRASVMWTQLVVVHFVAFLPQLCNKAQGHCTVITQQSWGIRRRNKWVWALSLFIGTPWVSCSSHAQRALQQSCILIRSHKNRKENEHVENLVFVVAAA